MPRKRSENSTMALNIPRPRARLILDLDLRFEFFGKQCLCAGNYDAITGSKAASHKPTARCRYRHFKLPAFELRRRDLHVGPCVVSGPDDRRFGHHDPRLRSAGRLQMAGDGGAGAKRKSLPLDREQEALPLKMRINRRTPPNPPPSHPPPSRTP